MRKGERFVVVFGGFLVVIVDLLGCVFFVDVNVVVVVCLWKVNVIGSFVVFIYICD